jgi:hypothetical protein
MDGGRYRDPSMGELAAITCPRRPRLRPGKALPRPPAPRYADPLSAATARYTGPSNCR